MSSKVADIFARFPEYFIKGSLDQAMTIYFSIGDDPSGKRTVKMDAESMSLEEGKTVDKADLLLKTSPELFEKMVMKGWTPGAMDFMRGKVKSNDPTGLLVLKKAFRFPGS